MSVTGDFQARIEELCRAHMKPTADRPASTARGVHHLALVCSDVEQTIGFYQDLLGFPLVGMFENRDYPGSTHFFFDIGNDNLLAFFDFPGLGLEQAVEAVGGVQHVALSVGAEEFGVLRDRLDAAGVAYLGPDRGLDRSMYLRDPDGIQIELLAEPRRVMDDSYSGSTAHGGAPPVGRRLTPGPGRSRGRASYGLWDAVIGNCSSAATTMLGCPTGARSTGSWSW